MRTARVMKRMRSTRMTQLIGGARPECLVDGVQIIQGRHDENGDSFMASQLTDSPGCCKSVHFGHHHIEKDDVRFEVFKGLQRLNTVFSI